MGTCRAAGRVAALVLGGAICALPLAAQQRRYFIETGAGLALTSFDDATNLESGIGGVARLGVWLPYRLSVEGEFGFSSPKSRNGPTWSVRTISAALLGNLAVGNSSSAYLKLGLGSTSYDNNLCPGSNVLGPCGRASAILGGAGFRAGITETIMARIEGLATRASEDGVMNVSGSLGVSIMIGSKPVTDSDRDGVFDTDDRCPDTPLGTLTDERGCPSDSDSDGVFDGLDRCPATPAGARVNAAGCPEDADADNVPDGVDQCPDTPAGAAVDSRGCPQDTDDDGVSDGLDRCPDTPKGASVDQLGCPGDEDGDRVLDGLDRCPRTPAGAAVNAFGCPPGVPEGTTGTAFAPGSRRVLPISFARQSARLPDAAEPVLDSLATALVAQPNVTIEIASHGDGTTAETRHLTQLRADAVRRYLIAKGVSLQRVTARGYGADQRLAGGTDAAAQARNRRIELRVLSAAPGR